MNEYVVGTELDNSNAVEKAAETTQLDNRNLPRSISGGIKPPYDPHKLASFQELNGTHSVAIGKKAQ